MIKYSEATSCGKVPAFISGTFTCVKCHTSFKNLEEYQIHLKNNHHYVTPISAKKDREEKRRLEEQKRREVLAEKIRKRRADYEQEMKALQSKYQDVRN